MKTPFAADVIPTRRCASPTLSPLRTAGLLAALGLVGLAACSSDAAAAEGDTDGGDLPAVVVCPGPTPEPPVISPAPAGLEKLQHWVQAAEVAKAMRELEGEAVGLAASDPARAVALLQRFAQNVGNELPQLRALREQRVAGLLQARAVHESPKLLADLGREQFRLGRFDAAQEALAAWLEQNTAKVDDEAMELGCWQAAAAGAHGDDGLRDRLLARLGELREQRAAAAGAAAAARAAQAQRAQAQRAQGADAGGGLDGAWVPVRVPRAPVGSGSGGAAAAQAARLQQLRADYQQAKAAYDADQQRYEAGMRYYQQQAGRLAALGGDPSSLMPAPPDPRLEARYRQAKQAYDAARGR